MLATGKTNKEAREALAKQREIDRLAQVKLDKKLKLERNKTAILTLARERKAETERLEAEKEENKRIDGIVKSMRLVGYKDSTKETYKNNTRLRTLAAERMKAEDLIAPPAAAAAAAPAAAAAAGTPPGTPMAAKRGRGRPPKAKAAAPAASAPASAPSSAPSSPPPVPTGKGFELNKSSLPYGARMLIERYDNEKKLRKN